MVYCFAPDCKHSSDTHTCKFWQPPQKASTFKKWELLLRRADRKLSRTAKVCQCHFKDGLKDNGPTIFKHNVQKCFAEVQSPRKLVAPKRMHRKVQKLIIPEPAVPEIWDLDLQDEDSGTPQEIDATVMAQAAEEPEEPTAREKELLAKIKSQDDHIKFLNRMLMGERKEVSFEILKSGTDIFFHYTGLTLAKFEAFSFLFEDLTINFFYDWSVDVINRNDQLLLFFMKMRQNFTYEDLAYRFSISTTTVANVFITWLHVVHKIFYEGVFLKLGIPSRQKNQQCLPEAFNEYRNCRIVVDCTEIKIERPGTMNMQKDTYSSYKSTNTFKALLGVAPNGCPTFASKLFPGSKSDKEMVVESKLLEKMVPGDCILADKGFLIADVLPPGVSLNMPPFLCTPQFSKEQSVSGEKVSGARSHVERAIKRIREYKILRLIPAQYRDFSTMIWQVCVALQEFNSPLIKEVEKQMK